MAIDFHFQALQVRNFRGVKSIDIDLPKNAPTVLIGANNGGKSTLLDAISLTLGGPAFYNYATDKYDFFHDAAGTASSSFDLTISFSAAAENQFPAVRGGFGNPVAVCGVRVSGVAKKDEYSHQSRLIGKDSKPIVLPTSVPLKGAAEETWKDHGLSYSKRNARWSDISEHRPDVWHLRPGNLFVSLYQWKSGPLRRLATLLAARFFDATWAFDYNNKKYPMPASLHKAHKFFAEAVKEFPFWRDDLKPRLQETLSLYVGRQARIDLTPDIRAIEAWLTEQLAISFSADAGGATTPLDKMGEGWQSLVRIAALDVLSQYPQDEANSRVVLLFEEPESFLHPHLSRKLRAVFERLAAAGWVVVITTHSPNVVSFSGNQSIVRLTRDGDSVRASAIRADEVDGAAKFQERLDERGAHEMLFAQKAVLCEGQDDVFAIRSYLQNRCDMDLDGRCVSIIRAGDVGQLPAFAAIASKLGIPWCAVSDEDRLPDGTIKQATEGVHQRVDALQSPIDCHVKWPKDLEACLKKLQGKASPQWQEQNIESKTLADLKKDHPDYVNSCEAIRLWLG